jgi:PAS domain S-box-containing protein
VVPPELYLRRTRDGQVLEIYTRVLAEGGMVRTYTDVTSYVRAEEALRDERQRLQWVLEATRPGIWETNVETGAMVVNDRWAEMLGYTLAELQPTTFETWRRLVHPQDLERAERVLHQHWRSELPFYECDLRMRHKNGHWVWINDRGRVHRRSASGEALYMSGTHLDIHERVAAQEQVRTLNASLERRVAERTAELERSMKDMEAISYSIAHDLRAPLRSVNGFAALVAEMDGDRLSPEGLQMFGRITHSSRNMGQMISDMLELLRVVRVEIDAVRVDMDALARSVTEALAPAVPHARVRSQPLPAVLGDAALLRQVLVNLMDNALKYSRHRAEPSIELGFDAERSAYFLRDNGMGFNMAHADKLFGLFQRLHTGTDAPGGTGVGLAIVARSVERHGGRIWAESTQGQGATFWWTLPLA